MTNDTIILTLGVLECCHGSRKTPNFLTSVQIGTLDTNKGKVYNG